MTAEVENHPTPQAMADSTHYQAPQRSASFAPALAQHDGRKRAMGGPPMKMGFLLQGNASPRCNGASSQCTIPDEIR